MFSSNYSHFEIQIKPPSICYTASHTVSTAVRGRLMQEHLTGRQENETKETKNRENPAESAGGGQSSRGSTRTCQSSRRDNKSDTERRPGPLWGSATHILTAHHSSRPVAGQIVNPAGRGYMATSDVSHLPSIKHTERWFGFSFPLHPPHSLCSSNASETFQWVMQPDF